MWRVCSSCQLPCERRQSFARSPAGQCPPFPGPHVGWNEPRALFSNASSVLHPTFDVVKPRQPCCPLQGRPIVSVCSEQAGNGKPTGKGASALQAALMGGPLEAGQESTYKLSFWTMLPGPRATMDKHCRVVQLPEAQPMGPVSRVPQGLPQSPTHSPAQGAASPHCFTCVGSDTFN